MRNRLLACVVLSAFAVIGAGAPALVAASSDLSQSQELVERAETGKRAVSLAHALADERDAQTRQLATKGAQSAPEQEPGTPKPDSPPQNGGAAEPVDTTTPQKQVDSRLRALRAELPADIRKVVSRIPDHRQQARAANGSPRSVLAVHSAYTEAIQALGRFIEDTARALPARATENVDASDPYALPYLGRRVEQASASRGLLLAALVAQGPQPELTAAAQQARVRELTADADFEQSAHEDTRERVQTTVTGSEVTTAERYLEKLTAGTSLSPAAQRFSVDRVDTNLTARVDRIRSVHSSLAGEEVQRLETLRDDDVTALQLHFAWAGAALLLAIGAGVYAARSMTRPLAVLRLGSRRVAADPTNEPPVRFTGRNDEYAEVVRSLSEVQEAAIQLRKRAEDAEADAVRQAAGRKKLAADHNDLRTGADELRRQLGQLDGAVHGAFVTLAQRGLDLVERQLGRLERIAVRESDPERLAQLDVLDHLATRMRRHTENLLLLAGADAAAPPRPQPASLLDLLREAASEIESHDRVRVTDEPLARVRAHAADDVSRLLAELLDNAAMFSPPEAEVQVATRTTDEGLVVLSVADAGIGMTGERLSAVNECLEAPEKLDPPTSEGDVVGIGMYVVAKLAARHGVRVRLRVQKQGGVTAVVELPREILHDVPEFSVPAPTHAEPASSREAVAEPAEQSNGEPTEGLPEEPTEAAEPTIPAETVVPDGGGPAFTDTGLPKRRTSGNTSSATPAPPVSDDHAEELRRRLDLFRQKTQTPEGDAGGRPAAEDSRGSDDRPGLPDQGGPSGVTHTD